MFDVKFQIYNISALKLGGNPQANFSAKAENESLTYPILSLRESKLRPLILRAYETKGQATYSAISTDFKINHGEEIDLLEHKRSQLGFAGFDVNNTQGFDAFEIRTFELFSERKNPQNQTLGATKEIVQPVFSRYWLHNSGAAPIGNDAVKVTLRPVEQMNELSTFAYDDKYNQGGTTTVAVRVLLSTIIKTAIIKAKSFWKRRKIGASFRINCSLTSRRTVHSSKML